MNIPKIENYTIGPAAKPKSIRFPIILKFKRQFPFILIRIIKIVNIGNSYKKEKYFDYSNCKPLTFNPDAEKNIEYL